MSRTIKAASAISVVTLGSRILGLVRDALMIRMLGASWVMGAFVLAWMIPNLLRRLFGEGALSAAFVPAYAKALDEGGPLAARRTLASVLGMLLKVLGAATALVLLLCWLLPPDLVGSSSDAKDAGGAVTAEEHGTLLLQLLALLFPYALPICLVAVLAGALNCLGVFAVPAAAPLILNLFWLGGIGWASWTLSTESQPEQAANLVAWCLIAAGIAQLLLVLVPLWRRRQLPFPILGSTTQGRQILRAMAPTVVGLSLVQINAALDQVLAVYLIDPGANTYLYIANRLLLFPHALTALALATAVFPQMAVLGARQERGQLRHHLDHAVFQTLAISLPACIGMMLVASPLIDLVFRGDEFTASDSHVATWTTTCLVAALPGVGVAQLHARALYALNDFAAPARIAIVLLFLNLGLNLMFIWLGFGVPGLALATSICAAFNAHLLRQRFLEHCPQSTAPREPLAAVLVATAVMGGLVYLAAQAFEAETRVGQAIFKLAVPVAAGIVAYAGLLRVLRVLPRIKASPPESEG